MSFPEEERRDWTEIIADDFSTRLYLISCDNDIVGFVTAWEFFFSTRLGDWSSIDTSLETFG